MLLRRTSSTTSAPSAARSKFSIASTARSPFRSKRSALRVDLPETTLFRVLLTLERHKYLQQHRDGTYQLAPKLIFGWLVQAADHVRVIARPELERLANTFDETVSLSYLYDDRIHVLGLH